MTALADELIKAFPLAEGGALQIIERRKSELTVDVANELHTRFKKALEDGDPNTAYAASMLASVVYLKVGKRYDGLKSMFDSVQVRFMAAGDAAAYDTVRTAALDCMSKAKQIGANDIAFSAALTAADCAYFAAQACGQSSNDGLLWMRKCLDGLETAATFAADIGGSAWLVKFASLTAQATRDAPSLLWLNDKAAIDAQLHRLAAAAEKSIPIEFRFPNDPVKTKNIGQMLAELSY
jgi:hypothetical protein